MEGLLEMSLKGQVNEGPAGGGELHESGEAALDDGKVAGSQVPVQVWHVGAHVDAFRCRQASRVDARAGDDEYSQAGQLRSKAPAFSRSG